MICPICGSSDHKVYTYKGTPLLMCPKAPEDKILTIPDDPNYCGLDPLTTGKWDPFYQSKACEDHDLNMSYQRKSPLGTALEFTVDALNTATINVAKAVYSVTFVVPYVLIGGLGGLIRDVIKRGRK